MPPSSPADQPKRTSKNSYLLGPVDVDVDMTSTSPKIVPTSPKIIHVGLDPAAELVKSSLMTSIFKPTPTLFSQKPEASMLSTMSSKSKNQSNLNERA